jgi:hypothetical protein
MYLVPRNSMSIVHVLLLGALFLSGCEIRHSGGVRSMSSSTEPHDVTVTIDGDAKRRGTVRMNALLSESSVFQAAGGWAGYSSFHMAPQSITVRRLTDQGVISWKIPFRDMSRRKWATFRLQDADEVIVNTLY